VPPLKTMPARSTQGALSSPARLAYDRYRFGATIKRDLPVFQNIPTNYARVGGFFIEIPCENSRRVNSGKSSFWEAHRATIYLAVTISVHGPDWKGWICEDEVASLRKHFANDRERRTRVYQCGRHWWLRKLQSDTSAVFDVVRVSCYGKLDARSRIRRIEWVPR
jgi:hypothetical protein